jgi:hypothetical protein
MSRYLAKLNAAETVEEVEALRRERNEQLGLWTGEEGESELESDEEAPLAGVAMTVIGGRDIFLSQD